MWHRAVDFAGRALRHRRRHRLRLGGQADRVAAGLPAPLGTFVERSRGKHILKAAVVADEQAAADVGAFGKVIFADEG